MKGLFIPGITTEMFRNGCLEGIEALMAEGEIYDIDYPCEDCISRQAVIDIVNNPLNIRLDEIIKKLPPVTPERPKGEWIWKERIKGGFATYTGDDTETGEKRTIVRDERRKAKLNFCSICGKVGDDTWLKFCPNCGADMRGVSE